MFIRLRRFVPAVSLVTLAIVALPAPAAAQADGLLSGNIKYNSGQSVQPIFEGWTKNADGSYQFHFGYLNRNHAEEVQIPLGNDNKMEPGTADRGQPTYFYTRFNRQLFSVTVPGDWGAKKELVWTLTAHGRSERAVAWLRPDWEIAPPGMGTDEKNKPPTLTLAGAPRIALPATLSITATVTDDGLPPQRSGRGRGSANRPPAFDNSEFKATTPVNVPQVERPVRSKVNDRVQVEWYVWRGPAAVSFDPALGGADAGKVVATATFTKPGEYVLRARAFDPASYTVQEIKVVVGASQQ
jgi:hypothetical protein